MVYKQTMLLNHDAPEPWKKKCLKLPQITDYRVNKAKFYFYQLSTVLLISFFF